MLPTIVPILATPFGVAPLPELEKLHPVLSELFAARIKSDRSPQRDPLCYRSADDLMEWPHESVQELANGIVGGIYSVIAAVNDFTEAQSRSLRPQARGCFTVVRQDGCVPAANYPLSAWCGVYCMAAPDSAPIRADSGLLRLYESRLGTMFADATTAVMRIPYTVGHYAWRPVPGQLAVFPASLTHEVALLRAPGELVLVTVRMRFVGPEQQGLGRW